MIGDIGANPEHFSGKKPHFVISNFNTDPAYYLVLCDSYTVYDQSTDPSIALRYASDTNFIRSKHTGHNLSDYFTFIIENWERLTELETVAFLKGNLVGRHVSEDYFLRVCWQTSYTFLWNDRNYRPIPGVSARASESEFLEINNSWYAETKPSHYFSSFNDLMAFLFADPQLPEMNLFAPGGCYIVPTRLIQRRPRELYELLLHIVSYQHFPAEAYFVERMMHILFTSNETLNPRIANIEISLRDLNAYSQERISAMNRPNLLRRAVGRLGRRLILWPV
jgi:hypothetical protein